MSDRMVDMSVKLVLRTLFGMLLGPIDLLLSMELIIFIISFLFVGAKKKELAGLFFK